MNASALLNRLNFVRAESRRAPYGTNIVMSPALLAASGAEEEGLWTLLQISPDGLDSAEAEARLARSAPT